ncbi:MAG: HEPN domain-containing protein [Candidatus Woesearchaeota archaeon]
MNKDAEMWIEQAEEDYRSATLNFKSKTFYVTAFLCQQAAEKALKAVYIYQNNKLAPKIHDLTELCRQTKTPEEIILIASRITSAYIFSRYPGAAPEIPSKFYNSVLAQEYLDKTKIILKWTKKQLK